MIGAILKRDERKKPISTSYTLFIPFSILSPSFSNQMILDWDSQTRSADKSRPLLELSFLIKNSPMNMTIGSESKDEHSNRSQNGSNSSVIQPSFRHSDPFVSFLCSIIKMFSVERETESEKTSKNWSDVSQASHSCWPTSLFCEDNWTGERGELKREVNRTNSSKNELDDKREYSHSTEQSKDQTPSISQPKREEKNDWFFD